MAATARVGINGFGRIGRLALRTAWGGHGIEIAHVNELNGDAATSAHPLEFDSVHGRWPRDVRSTEGALVVDGVRVGHTSLPTPGPVPWADAGVDRL